jgi:enoyl-CoA hydratase
MTGATDKILSVKKGALGYLTFNNPDRRNAVSLEMWQSVAAVLTDFEDDPAVRVVIMQGAGGRSFVSGSDISQFDDLRKNAEQSEAFAKFSSAALQKMGALSKPLIAMIQGYCVGGGVRVAACADIRVASGDSVFQIPAAKLGLGYSFESAEVLVSLVGPAFAKEMLFTGRRLSADEALRIGLINRVTPGDQLERTTEELAHEIARNAPLSVRAAKISIDQAVLDPEKRDPALIAGSIRACFDSQDYTIGRKAFKDKTTPEFTGR